jgi:uncharacterized protein
VKALIGVSLTYLLPLAAFATFGTDVDLVEAAKNRDKAAIRTLLQQHVDVNAVQPDGSTALAWASHWDDLESADLLIRAGADVNRANQYGVAPLTLACTNGSPAMVEKLLVARANPNVSLPTGETALMTCARTGNAGAVKALLAHKADVNGSEPRRGQTALMWALEQKHPDVARVLVEHGADVHARSESGFTPLLFATRQGDLESVRTLLAAGADINEATPVRSGVRDQYDRGTSPGGLTPLLMASASGHEELAIFLLDQGANPNAADDAGVTALHYGLLRGISLLGGAHTHIAVNSYLLRPHMTRLVKALIAHGANVNARLTKEPPRPPFATTPRISMAGATPFLLAVETLDLDMMRFLLAKGADPMVPTNANVTALMLAAGLGNRDVNHTPEEKKKGLEAAKLLVDLGADVNAVGENGYRALHGAAFNGEDEIIQFLVDKGAAIEAMDKFGETALSIAENVVTVQSVDFTKRPQGFQPTSAKLLLKLGALPVDVSGVQRLDIVKDAATVKPSK